MAQAGQPELSGAVHDVVIRKRRIEASRLAGIGPDRLHADAEHVQNRRYHVGVADHGGDLLAAAQPRLKVYVHERGAPHMVDPEKLVRSATMIYGAENMLRLWGEMKSVPAGQIIPLVGGETLRLGTRTIAAAYTPGHAVHHMAWYDEATGTAFTGDVLGEQLGFTEVPIPVTPPPDIDVELMLASGDKVMEWQPERLFLTHFGPVSNPGPYVQQHATRLVLWSERVRASLAEDGTDEDRARRCRDLSRQDLEALLPKELHQAIEEEAIYGNWFGLARYWRKKGVRA